MPIYTLCCQPNNLPTDLSTLLRLVLHYDLVCAVDDCRVSQLVLLDHSAAFYMVDHQILLCVLS